jgi:hypothetical protein
MSGGTKHEFHTRAVKNKMQAAIPITEKRQSPMQTKLNTTKK